MGGGVTPGGEYVSGSPEKRRLESVVLADYSRITEGPEAPLSAGQDKLLMDRPGRWCL